MDKVRIDKWLWAARFFKTRSLAKQAIDGGKVHCDGQRVKTQQGPAAGHDADHSPGLGRQDR